MLRFKVKNLKPSKDLTIWVDGNRNKLSAKQRVYYNDNTTFTYAVALEGDENQVEVTFSKGKYNLSDVEAYIATLPGTELYESEFLQNSTKTKGNVIVGNLTMQKSGYHIPCTGDGSRKSDVLCRNDGISYFICVRTC